MPSLYGMYGPLARYEPRSAQRDATIIMPKWRACVPDYVVARAPSTEVELTALTTARNQGAKPRIAKPQSGPRQHPKHQTHDPLRGQRRRDSKMARDRPPRNP
jgi:hypothetical protein